MSLLVVKPDAKPSQLCADASCYLDSAKKLILDLVDTELVPARSKEAVIIWAAAQLIESAEAMIEGAEVAINVANRGGASHGA